MILAVSSTKASQVMTYRACLAQVDENPMTGYNAALRWRDNGGGPKAQHCMALALMGQGDYAHAAQMLEEAARAMEVRAGAAQQVPPLLSQAGNAWLLADDGSRAYELFDEALAQRGLSTSMRAELLVDRSRASAAVHDYALAIEDLNAAMALVGPRYDLLTYRSSAHRLTDKVVEAQEDIERALKLAPRNPNALYERGNLKFALGDIEEAQADWQMVIALDDHSGAAELAKRNLAELDAAVMRAATTPAEPTPDAPQDQIPEVPALVE